MSTARFVALENRVDRVEKLLEELERVIRRLAADLETLAIKRGPGRPKGS